MMAARRIFLVLFLAAALPLFTSAAACNRTCGASEVPYPFGFSKGCPILLNCSEGGDEHPFRFRNFTVRNVTSGSLWIDLPPSCNRSVSAAKVFFGENYGMTARNTLLLGDCSSSSAASACLVSLPNISKNLGLSAEQCNSTTINCFSGNASNRDDDMPPLLKREFIDSINCSYLYSSMIFTEQLSSITLKTVELVWWLGDRCSLCHKDANCSVVQRTLLNPGKKTEEVNNTLCECRDGFTGDGFSAGSGCQRDAVSTPFWRRKAVRIWFGILIGGVVAIALFVAFLCLFIRRRSISTRMRRSTKRLLSEASCSVPLYPFREIERATNGFSEQNRLGTGAYGTVYVGKLSNHELVAVKRIRQRETDGTEQVMNEIKLLSSVSHPNLVRLLGCCIERGEQILVYEFMPNGTLAQQLQRESRRPGLPWTVRLAIAADTAKAIAHLHSAIHPPIYHRDIKSSNILLDYNFNSKVADFGLSKMIISDLSHVSTAPQGTPGYLDPQYHQNFHLSDKSDVYSFGVVLVEIITALKVVDFNRSQSEINLAALAIDKIGKGCVEDIIDPFLEPHRDAWTLSSIHEVAELAFRCLAFHRDMRPSMKEVADELEQIRRSAWAASDDNVFLSPGSSICSSPSLSTEKSRRTSRSNRVANTSSRSNIKLTSPVSVQDPWYSDQSSPSANSLLGNPVH